MNANQSQKGAICLLAAKCSLEWSQFEFDCIFGNIDEVIRWNVKQAIEYAPFLDDKHRLLGAYICVACVYSIFFFATPISYYVMFVSHVFLFSHKCFRDYEFSVSLAHSILVCIVYSWWSCMVCRKSERFRSVLRVWKRTYTQAHTGNITVNTQAKSHEYSTRTIKRYVPQWRIQIKWSQV